MRIEVSEIINAPVADVWRFYAIDHVHNHPRWDPDLQLEQLSDGPIGVGTVIKRVSTRSGTSVEGTMEVLEFERESAMGVVINDGGLETRGSATFDADGPGRTRITLRAEMQWADESLDPELVKGLVQRSARNIKRLVESES